MYAEERVDAEDEPAEERDGRVEDNLSEVREYGTRCGYGSGKCEGSIDGTFGGRAKGSGGEESERKEDSLSDLARTKRDNECACDGDGVAEDVSGDDSNARRSVAIIVVKLGGG